MPLPKQAVAFPEVAVIRKGTPKRKYAKNGRESWIQGLDLNSRFRVAFAPGADDARAAFGTLYPDSFKTYGDDFAEKTGFELSRLRCMITTRNVSEAWTWANEAYNAGRLVARADDTHFITLRNPLSGEFEVEDGEPVVEFKHGQSVTYERDGKPFTLPIRTYGRLSLFLPDLKRMVRFTLKTTSFYDRLSISANLNALQFLADTLNGGNAAGIPFDIYRREQEITWNKPDGSAQRIKKWIICIEADPEWVESAVRRMGQFALGQVVNPRALLPEVVGMDPDDAEDEASPEQETVTVEPEPEPKPLAPASTLPAGNVTPPTRPHTAEDLREKLQKIAADYITKGYTASDKQRNFTAILLNKCFMGDEKQRKTVTTYLFGRESLKVCNDDEILALLKWLDPKLDSGGDYNPGPHVEQEAQNAYRAALIEAGQTEMDLPF